MRRARKGNRLVRWGCLVGVVGLFAAYAANLPLYAGGGLGRGARWRMEHGRIRVERSPTAADGPLWIAMNAEGLRFLPAWRFRSRGDWMVNVPLWMPLLPVAALGTWAWWPRRPARGACGKCGYIARGLEVCPECGSRQRSAGGGARDAAL